LRCCYDPNGAKAKFIAQASTRPVVQLVGREQIVAITTELTLEMLDFDEYDQSAAERASRCRCGITGADRVVGGADRLQLRGADTYGLEPEWGDSEGEPTTADDRRGVRRDAGPDIRAAVQNTRTTL
jgi:hypothetical protein